MDLELATLVDMVVELRKRFDAVIIITRQGDRMDIEGGTPGKFKPAEILSAALEAVRLAEERWGE